MKKIFFSFFLVGVGFPNFAQKVEFGGGGGMTYYKGDLQPTFRPLNPGVGGDLFFRYNFDRVISAKLNIFYGLIKGYDSKSGDDFLQERDFSFNHNVLDYALQLEYNFLNFRTHTGRYEHDWTPYLFGGIGLTKVISNSYAVAEKAYISSDKIKGAMILPYGIGIKKILTPRLNLSAEFSTRVFLDRKAGALFDGLDGIEKVNVYKELGLIQEAEPVKNDYFYAIPNTKLKDKYFHLSVTLSYLIYRVNCNVPGKSFYFF